MKINKDTYLKLFLVFAIFLCAIWVYISSSNETPRVILFFGRFHPLLLHLPIGALSVTFFIDVIGRIRKDYPLETIKYSLTFSSVSAFFTCLLGYFLSLEGGYNESMLDIHFWAGIATTVLAVVLFILVCLNTESTKKAVLPLFIVSLFSIGVTGHYGGNLTHGENFLTEYISAPKKEKTITVVDSVRLYQDVVSKILDAKCVQCHNSTKKKGDISLVSKEALLKGGETGIAFHSGNAEESLLYKQLLLPISHEEHMPPEGKPQLTKDEIWLLKYWIDNNLDFENYALTMIPNDTLNVLLKKYLVINKKRIPKASKDDIEKVKLAGFRINELIPGEAELSVKYLKKSILKEEINKLKVIKEQIVELDFSNSDLEDEMTEVFKKMKNLKVLRLDNSKITDISLNNVKKLSQLRVLNLYHTQITDKGLKEMLKSVQPEQIYTWQTDVSTNTVKRLQELYKIQIHNGIRDDFVEITKLKQPLVIPEQTLFTDSITVSIENSFRNAELKYTLNGKIPDSLSALYKEEIHIKTSKSLKVRAFKKGWLPSEVLERDYFKIKHQVKKFTIINEPDTRYPNARKIFDLEEGSLSFKDNKWTGYLGYDLNTTMDLGASKIVDNISVSCLENVGNWILFPIKVTVFASENKNSGFKKAGEFIVKSKTIPQGESLKTITINMPNTKARYFRVIVKNPKVLPNWHQGKGEASWIFVSEIFLW